MEIDQRSLRTNIDSLIGVKAGNAILAVIDITVTSSSKTRRACIFIPIPVAMILPLT